MNLVANALRHSGSDEIGIEAACEPDGRGIALRIVDQGRGISRDDQARVFEKFMSLHGDPSADTGLGLPFCKLAVERMAGRIALTSALGVGTTFTVVLPCAPS